MRSDFNCVDRILPTDAMMRGLSVGLCVVLAGCSGESTTPAAGGSATGNLSTAVAVPGDSVASSAASSVEDEFSIDDLDINAASSADSKSVAAASPTTATAPPAGATPDPTVPQAELGSKSLPPELLSAPTRRVEEQYADKSPKRQFEAKQLPSGSYLYHGKYFEYRPDKSVLKTGTYDYGKKVGEWTFFGPMGKVLKQGIYAEDKPVGEWKKYRPDGTLERLEIYDQQGNSDGEWQAYLADGTTLQWTRSFKNGNRHGSWIDYVDGKKSVEVSFLDGKQEGATRQWNASGQLMSEGHFANGLRHGKFTSWNDDGSVRKEEAYEQGRLKTDK